MARKWYTYETRQRLKGQGINDAWEVRHKSVGKENSDTSPYLVANESICGTIAQQLRLPIPPFALVRSGTSKGMYVSFKFGSRYSLPPDAIFNKCFKALPNICTGILLFDILVANSDRHEGNVKVDSVDSPTEIEMFDHDRALFGEFEGDGKKRLTDLLTRLGVTGGPVTLGNRQCFLNAVDSTLHFDFWIQRISGLSEFFIGDICAEAPGITKEEQEMAFKFLTYRKRELPSIIKAHKDQFKNIADWGLFL